MLGPNWDCTPQCDMKENRQAARHALRRMGETSLRAPLSSQFRNRWLLFSEEGRKEGSKGLHGEIAMERKARRETGWMKGGGRFEERTISPSFLSMSAFRPRSVRPFGFLRGCHNVSSQEEIFSTIKSVVVTTYIATDSL